jgi:hypothetical protein
MSPDLIAIAPGLWEIPFPFSILGVRMGRRTVIVQLPDGSLQLHSPGPIVPSLLSRIEQIGPVSALILPTNFHDTYTRENLLLFPKASWYAPDGFPKVHPPDRPPQSFENAPPLWRETLTWKKLEGIPSLNEHLFLHKPSRTLLVADVVFNIGPEAGAWTRLFFQMNNAYNQLRPTRLFRACIKDRAAFRTSTEEVFQWDFDRLVPCHGEIVHTGARERLQLEFKF